MPNYNHYTPQSDGSYRRSTVAENPRHPQQTRTPYATQRPPNPPQKQEQAKQPELPEKPSPSSPCPVPEKQNRQESEGILSFLRGLLPRQIDAADLLVIALLLLINREECDEDDLSPLLTIALYFLL